ncbi:hypothetical protein HA402_005957 [Bradysia odoriphaga]|nr:hypothetical protein HA402_005957 [Bradysia odoriphaga]
MQFLVVAVVAALMLKPVPLSADRCLEDLVTLYRLFNPNSDDHFYTTSLEEANIAANTLGYNFEQSPGLVSTTSSDCECGNSFAPVYRLYRPGSKADHFYTLSESEADNAVTNLGYNREGIAFYCVHSLMMDCDASLSFHRYWRGTGSGTDHFYTTDFDEGNRNVIALGGQYEGVMCNIWPVNTTANNCQLALNNLVPLHRLYHRVVRDHFYTTSTREADNAATSLGYIREMSPGLVATNQCDCECGASLQPVIRLYKKTNAAGPNRRDDHFYTTNSTEATEAVKSLGYKRVGTAYYCSAVKDKCGAKLALHSAFKLAKVVPIPKPGKDHKLTTSYRPISLLSCLGKIFEKCLCARLSTFATVNDIISKEQFGFRPQHSTTHQIKRVVNTVKRNKRDRKSTGLILLDIEKAFDSVWHNGLIYKLNAFGVPGYLLKLIKSFISDRSFVVSLNGTYSSTRKIPAGLPQGSVISDLILALHIRL